MPEGEIDGAPLALEDDVLAALPVADTVACPERVLLPVEVDEDVPVPESVGA